MVQFPGDRRQEHVRMIGMFGAFLLEQIDSLLQNGDGSNGRLYVGP